MNKLDFLNDLAKRLCDALPPGLHTLKQDAEKNIQAVLKTAFSKLDLVTREEFDAQTKVLARSRKKIETMEARIRELEKILEEKNP